MSKYSKLKDYLLNVSENRVVLTFGKIENILGSKLPESARTYREWWGNDTHHTQAKNGWLAAGWQVISVDFGREMVEFSRIGELGHRLDGKDEKAILKKGSTEISWKEFEEIARVVMSKYFGVELKERHISGHPKTFDLVSEDGKVVGDAKFLTMVRGGRENTASQIHGNIRTCVDA
jgi:hypothetical protein